LLGVSGVVDELHSLNPKARDAGGVLRQQLGLDPETRSEEW
jgi:hypothetical protein